MTAPHETAARAQHVHSLAADMLAAFGDHLIGPYKLTLVARNLEVLDGSRDLVVTDDDCRNVVDALQRRLATGVQLVPVMRA